MQGIRLNSTEYSQALSNQYIPWFVAVSLCLNLTKKPEHWRTIIEKLHQSQSYEHSSWQNQSVLFYRSLQSQCLLGVFGKFNVDDRKDSKEISSEIGNKY